MIRVSAFTILSLVLLGSARAELPVAPPPREIRSDGSRDPVPQPELVKKENPLEVVERIIKNSKDAGEKLAMTDTGIGTRKTQETILKDIDTLLNQDPPPPKSDKDKDKDKDQDQDKKQDPNEKKKDMDPMTGKDDMPPKMKDPMPMGMGGMGDPPPGEQPKERRPRQGDPMPDDQPKQPDPKDGKPKGTSKVPMNPGGGVKPDPKGGKLDPSPLLPFENEVVKDVWGHLPDKLRQQATQYYKEEMMARYSDLLRMYYSSLAEKK